MTRCRMLLPGTLQWADSAHWPPRLRRGCDALRQPSLRRRFNVCPVGEAPCHNRKRLDLRRRFGLSSFGLYWSTSFETAQSTFADGPGGYVGTFAGRLRPRVARLACFTEALSAAAFLWKAATIRASSMDCSLRRLKCGAWAWRKSQFSPRYCSSPPNEGCAGMGSAAQSARLSSGPEAGAAGALPDTGGCCAMSRSVNVPRPASAGTPVRPPIACASPGGRTVPPGVATEGY